MSPRYGGIGICATPIMEAKAVCCPTRPLGAEPLGAFLASPLRELGVGLCRCYVWVYAPFFAVLRRSSGVLARARGYDFMDIIPELTYLTAFRVQYFYLLRTARSSHSRCCNMQTQTHQSYMYTDRYSLTF